MKRWMWNHDELSRQENSRFERTMNIVKSVFIKGNVALKNRYISNDGEAQGLNILAGNTEAQFNINLGMLNGTELRFWDVGSSNYVGFEAPALAANQIWVLPAVDGNASEVLGTNAAGTLGWYTASSMAGGLHDGDTLQHDSVNSNGGAFAFNTTGILTFSNTVALTTCANAGVDTDKFLVLDATNNIDFRTGTEIWADIGGAAHLHDGDTLQNDGINSDGGIFSFTTSAKVEFSNDVDVDGHLGISNASPQAASLVYAYENMTATTDVYGLRIFMDWTPSANNTKYFYPMFFFAQLLGNNNIADFFTLDFSGLIGGGGTMRNYRGVRISASVLAGATKALTGYLRGIDVNFATQGPVLNVAGAGYQIYLNDYTDAYTVAGTKYGIRQEGSTLLNDFDGTIAISNDNNFLYLGDANDAGIAYDGNNMTLFARLVGAGDFNFVDAGMRVNSWKNDSDTQIFGTAATAVLTVDAGANMVGINDTSPSFKLDIYTILDSAADDSIVARFYRNVAADGEAAIRIENSSNVKWDLGTFGGTNDFNLKDSAGTYFNIANASGNTTLTTDGVVFGFGVHGDVTLTHVHNVGMLLNSSMQFQFGDSGTYIAQLTDGHLDLTADIAIDLNATTTYISGIVGVQEPSPSGTVHIRTGDAGAAIAWSALYDDLIVENDSACGITIACPDLVLGSINFATPSNSQAAVVSWDYTAGEFLLGSKVASAVVKIHSGNNILAMTLDANQDVILVQDIFSPSDKKHQFGGVLDTSYGYIEFDTAAAPDEFIIESTKADSNLRIKNTSMDSVSAEIILETAVSTDSVVGIRFIGDDWGGNDWGSAGAGNYRFLLLDENGRLRVSDTDKDISGA